MTEYDALEMKINGMNDVAELRRLLLVSEKERIELKKENLDTRRENLELKKENLELKKENCEMQAREMERKRSDEIMSDMIRQMKAELSGSKEENQMLKKQLEHIASQNSLQKNDLFGRQTEKISDLLKSGAAAEDPLSESADPEDKEPAETEHRQASTNTSATTPEGNRPELPAEEDTQGENAEPGAEEKNGGNSGTEPTAETTGNGGKRPRGKRPRGKRRADMDNLPHLVTYDYDPDELDAMYGKGNWRVATWHMSEKMEYVPEIVYAHVIYTPVISAGLEHRMECQGLGDVLLPGSDATSSLVAGIMYNKFSLGLPVNRQENHLGYFDVNLARSKMNQWVIRFSRDLFSKVYAHLEKQLKKSGYTQSDETTLLVIRDGRAPGTKSYMWVHITSELVECHPIAIFSYEATRSTEHLREFYVDYVGKIICDAFSAYHTYESEMGGVIIICGCWMHARRRWAQSLRLRNVKGLTNTQIDELPEAKILRLIARIYKAEGELKSKKPAERLAGRNSVIRPLIEEYFSLLESFDMDEPSIPEKMKDAIQYSLNQKEYLCRFLEDAAVPIDNGACERRIRSYAIGRNGWLFCTSTNGAEASAIIYSLVETAKSNGANPYYYLKYLLEKAPSSSMPDFSDSFMEDLMPWSEDYKAYEKAERQKIFDVFAKLSDKEPTGKRLMKYPGQQIRNDCQINQRLAG